MSDICYRCQYYDEVYDPDTGDEYIHCSAGDNTDIPANCPEKEGENE